MVSMKATLSAAGIGFLMLGLVAAPAPAQSNEAVTGESVAPAPDSAPGVEKKKKGGGLFGKAKKLAGNKVVKQVAKTMACTMVPGGQVVAGAIDAASSDDVGAAAAGAAGAATGQPCMPGIIGAAPNPAAGVPGVGGLGAAAGAAGLAGMAYMGPGGETGGAMAYGGMPAGFDMDAVATCMGLTSEEFLLLSDPTGGTGLEPAAEDMERQRRVAAKVDPARYQACVIQQRGGGVGGLAAAPAVAADDDEAPADGKLSEAPGKQVGLPKNLRTNLDQGRVTVRDIDWLTGGGSVAEAGAAGFGRAMAALAAALGGSGGTWRADIYLDRRYGDAAASAIGSARLETVVAALVEAGVEAGAVSTGKSKRDKRQRLEIVRTGK
jgi:hypothetical protein